MDRVVPVRYTHLKFSEPKSKEAFILPIYMYIDRFSWEGNEDFFFFKLFS